MAAENETKKDLDEFSYLETGGFSSERFKVEVKNLPKYYGISEFRKLLTTKLSLKPVKVKPPFKKGKWMFISFPNDEERNKAVTALDGYQWKGSTLKCFNSKPAPDPLVKKRKHDNDSQNKDAKKIDLRSQEERIKDTATPLWKIPYHKQIEIKQNKMRDVLVKIGSEIWKVNYPLRGYIEEKQKLNNGLICDYLPIKTAEKIEGYRNKCEFTIGMDLETNLPTVGFRLATYVSGHIGVAPVEELCHISSEMKKAVLLFQGFVRSSNLKVYSPEDHSGHWKQLTIRQSALNNDLMFIISINPQDLDETQIDELKKSIVKYIIDDNVDTNNIKSIYFMCLNKNNVREPPPKMDHLYGETHIYDVIHGLKFRISPQAFFQINTKAAEILYQTAIDMSQLESKSTVFDICCGTGTIGLCFAKHCDQVLGLEIIPEAVIDAKANAVANNIENAEFYTGKAEDILSSVVARSRNDDVVAIVDPPRSGLHMRAVVQLRRMRNIKKLVYISCDPSAALKNFVDLGKAASKTMHGDPFILTKAVAVDMFPYTNHTELVLSFERMKKPENVASNIEELKTSDCAEEIEKTEDVNPSPNDAKENDDKKPENVASNIEELKTSDCAEEIEKTEDVNPSPNDAKENDDKVIIEN